MTLMYTYMRVHAVVIWYTSNCFVFVRTRNDHSKDKNLRNHKAANERILNGIIIAVLYIQPYYHDGFIYPTVSSWWFYISNRIIMTVLYIQPYYHDGFIYPTVWLSRFYIPNLSRSTVRLLCNVIRYLDYYRGQPLGCFVTLCVILFLICSHLCVR